MFTSRARHAHGATNEVMRRILVTGANKGIGQAIVRAIVDEHDDTFVYLAARDRDRGQSAVKSIGSDRVAFLELDVTSDASVAAALKALHGERLYGLVNNAGIGGENALADILAVNVFGLRRVTEAFAPLVDERIVNVTSASGPTYVSKQDDARKALLLDPMISWPRLAEFLEGELKRNAGDAYGLSKAAANAYTVLFAREHPKLAVNACTPGFIETDMTRHYVSPGQSAADAGMKPPSAGARAPLHLLFAKLDGNGRYYGSDAKRSPLDRYRAPGSAEYTD